MINFDKEKIWNVCISYKDIKFGFFFFLFCQKFQVYFCISFVLYIIFIDIKFDMIYFFRGFNIIENMVIMMEKYVNYLELLVEE